MSKYVAVYPKSIEPSSKKFLGLSFNHTYVVTSVYLLCILFNQYWEIQFDIRTLEEKHILRIDMTCQFFLHASYSFLLFIEITQCLKYNQIVKIT